MGTFLHKEAQFRHCTQLASLQSTDRPYYCASDPSYTDWTKRWGKKNCPAIDLNLGSKIICARPYSLPRHLHHTQVEPNQTKSRQIVKDVGWLAPFFFLLIFLTYFWNTNFLSLWILLLGYYLYLAIGKNALSSSPAHMSRPS